MWDIVIIKLIYQHFGSFVEMFRKIFAIVGAVIAGGLGIAILGTGTQVAHAGVQLNQRKDEKKMARKFFAIIGAIIGGGLGIAVLGTAPAVQAGMQFN